MQGGWHLDFSPIRFWSYYLTKSIGSTPLKHSISPLWWPTRPSRKKVKAAQSWLSESSSLWLFATPWNFLSQNNGVGSLSLLQGIFLTWGSNLGLPHCGWILYQLSHKWSPRILEWIANPFSKGSSQSRNRTGVSCIAGRFFIIVYTLIIYTLFWWSGTIENAQYLQCLPALQKIRLQKCW